MAYQIGHKVNIRNIKDTHAEFVAYVDEQDVIEIDAGEVGECDLSLIQLIEAARLRARAVGKPISLTRPANEAIVSTLGRAGFLESLSGEDAKFWLHTEMN